MGCHVRFLRILPGGVSNLFHAAKSYIAPNFRREFLTPP
jgi:hypothetical protein